MRCVSSFLMERKPPRLIFETPSPKVAVIAITAALYAVGKALTGYIPTPWGVGQFLIGVFLPGYFAVVSDTLSVAIGAGIGPFVGGVVFLLPLHESTPFLNLCAGGSANFLCPLLL